MNAGRYSGRRQVLWYPNILSPVEYEIMRMLLFILLASFSSLVLAQENPAGLALTQRFGEFIASKDISGAVLMVGTKDAVLYHKALGQANIAEATAMTLDTRFRIASMTKPITSMAIMMLQDDGKLNVTDSVEKHLPEFKNQLIVQSRDAGKGTITLGKPKRAITVRDLLTHTSGLPSGYPAGAADVYQKRHYTLSETTALSSQQPLNFEPGTKWEYCNAGIDTLGRIVEVLSGQSYEAFLQTRLFDKLGMKHSRFALTPEEAKQLAVVYSKKDGELSVTSSSITGLPKVNKHPIPAAGLVSTAGDMGKLYACLLNGTVVDGKALLSATALAEMTKTQTGDIKTGFVDGMSFGYGFQVVAEPKGATSSLNAGSYGHGGAFATQGWIDPKAGVYYVLMTQRTGLANSDASPMRQELQRLGRALLK